MLRRLLQMYYVLILDEGGGVLVLHALALAADQLGCVVLA